MMAPNRPRTKRNVRPTFMDTPPEWGGGSWRRVRVSTCLAHSFRPALGLALALCFLFIAGADRARADVVFFDTLKNDRSLEIIEGFKTACGSCGKVDYRDMKGDPRRGDSIADEINGAVGDGRVDLVIALGRPAAQVAIKKIRGVPIFYSLVGRSLKAGGDGQLVRSFEADAPVIMQLAALKQMVPSIETVAVVHDPSHVASVINSVTAAAAEFGMDVQSFSVSSPRDVPTAIRTAVRDCDSLIFFRDPTVTNRDSVNFIIKTTLENRKPTIAYSKALVDLGLLFTLLPDYHRVGDRMGQAADGLIANGAIGDAPAATEADFSVYYNMTSAKHIEGIQLDSNVHRSKGAG